MAKLIQKNQNTIPFGKYFIDSFKLFIDINKLTATNIPENFTLIDTDTGEIINEFKKNSLHVAYKNTVIYIGVFRRVLNKHHYDKLMMIFSSKVSGKNYFHGILKQDVIDILNFLKDKKYIDFIDVSEVFKNIYTNDTDIKIDFLFTKPDREKVIEYNKELSNRFQFDKCELHKYNNEKMLGIQTFNRERSALSKPFLKFYDKTKELLIKHADFFATLPPDIQEVVSRNFIYRFEFTMKDKKFFAKFGLSNRLEEVLEVLNTKWQEVAKFLLNVNFQVRIKRSMDTTKLKYFERIMTLDFFDNIHKNNLSPHELKIRYTACQKTKEAKFKASKLFDRIYQNVSQDKAAEISADYENIKRFDKIFGLTT